ncbi:hypothetical protein DRP04_13025 [Archaeoglobales archaeon]|nr:MAG: hypothetical protein DRP04_13025 [Archaeoglobales archaeon]
MSEKSLVAQKVPDEILHLEMELKGIAHEYFASMQRVQGHKRMMNDLEEKHGLLSKYPLVKGLMNGSHRTLMRLHKSIRRIMERKLREHPIYHEFFEKIPGAGPVVACFLLGMAPARKFPNISKLWKYVGLAPKNKYTAYKSFNIKVAWALHNAFEGFLRAGPNNNFYARYYYYWREKIEEELRKKAEQGTLKIRPTKRFIHLLTAKKVKRMFTGHYWEFYRKYFGLPVVEPYFVMIGLKHLYIPPEQALESMEL